LRPGLKRPCGWFGVKERCGLVKREPEDWCRPGPGGL